MDSESSPLTVSELELRNVVDEMGPSSPSQPQPSLRAYVVPVFQPACSRLEKDIPAFFSHIRHHPQDLDWISQDGEQIDLQTLDFEITVLRTEIARLSDEHNAIIRMREQYLATANMIANGLDEWSAGLPEFREEDSDVYDRSSPTSSKSSREDACSPTQASVVPSLSRSDFDSSPKEIRLVRKFSMSGSDSDNQNVPSSNDVSPVPSRSCSVDLSHVPCFEKRHPDPYGSDPSFQTDDARMPCTPASLHMFARARSEYDDDGGDYDEEMDQIQMDMAGPTVCAEVPKRGPGRPKGSGICVRPPSTAGGLARKKSVCNVSPGPEQQAGVKRPSSVALVPCTPVPQGGACSPDSNAPVKRKRGRPRKIPLPEAVVPMVTTPTSGDAERERLAYVFAQQIGSAQQPAQWFSLSDKVAKVSVSSQIRRPSRPAIMDDEYTQLSSSDGSDIEAD